MKKNNSTWVIVMILTLSAFLSPAAYAGGCTYKNHYIKVKTYDSAKGLVYADTATIKRNPVYVESIDLKWSDVTEMDEFTPDIIYPAYGYAQASEGYVFTGWTKNDINSECFSYDNPSLLSSEATTWYDSDDKIYFPDEPDDMFYALFGKVACDVEPNSKYYKWGSVSSDKPINVVDDKVTFTAIPTDNNIYFKNWKKNGQVYSTENPITITAEDNPCTYYACFDYNNEDDYNFAESGEWRFFYNKSLNAHVPTAAEAAYLLPSKNCSDDTYYLYEVDTLQAGTPYLIYGKGKGTIEYFAREEYEVLEAETPLIYTKEGVQVTSCDDLAYYVLDRENLNFRLVDSENYQIEAGECYMTKEWPTNDIIEYKGVLPCRFDFEIESYYYIDYENNTEGISTDIQKINMNYDKYKGVYIVNRFFDYEVISGAFVFPGAITDVVIPMYNKFFWFNYILEHSDNLNFGWTRRLEYIDSEENVNYDSNLDDLMISYDETTDNYTMTPFWIWKGIKEDMDSNWIVSLYKYIEPLSVRLITNAGIKDVVMPNDNVKYKIINGRIVFDDIVEAYIYNLNGNLIKHVKDNIISDLSKGVYIIRINSSSIKVIL